MVFQVKFKPTNGVHLPAAMGLMVITGFFALCMILATVSASTCIKNPMQL
jgi:hypothetical protein